MKIELDLPVPEGWRFVGYQVPKEGQGYITSVGFIIAESDRILPHITFERDIDEELEAVKAKFPVGSKVKYKKGVYGLEGQVRVIKNVFRSSHDYSLMAEYADVVNGFGDVRNLEPYVEDTELEEAKKRFPVDSWVKQAGITNNTILYKVKEVTRENVADGHFPVVVLCYDISFFLLDVIPFPLPTWRCCASDKPKKDGNYFVRFKEGEDKRIFRFEVAHGWNLETSRIMSLYEWLDEGERS